MNPNRMSNPQQQVWQFIRTYQEANGYSPTIREIAAALGYASTATVQDHLVNLRAKGFVTGAGRTLKAVQ